VTWDSSVLHAATEGFEQSSSGSVRLPSPPPGSSIFRYQAARIDSPLVIVFGSVTYRGFNVDDMCLQALRDFQLPLEGPPLAHPRPKNYAPLRLFLSSYGRGPAVSSDGIGTTSISLVSTFDSATHEVDVDNN
jgi:hypothetical protein